MALQLPMIKLVDGSSGGGSVTTIMEQGYSYVPPMVGFDAVVQQLNMGIPNLGAVLGPAIGLGVRWPFCLSFTMLTQHRLLGLLHATSPSWLQTSDHSSMPDQR